MADAAESETNSQETKQQSTEWFLVYDDENDRDYYFNIQTQESLWEPPAGMENFHFQRYEEAEDEDETEEETQSSGWHYIDMTGTSQGPYQKEQLLEWRGHFPMNTLFWTTDQMNSESDEQRGVKHATFLANIIGDSELFQKWRSETMNHETRVAPSATDYVESLEQPVEDQVQQNLPDDVYSHEISYADAVLAGLPPEDETVQLADLAKQSGTPLQDIVRFVDTASCDGTMQQLIVKDPYTGKMTAVSSKEAGETQQLYGEFESWIDPSKMEQGLAKSAKYRREKLPSLWMKQVGYKKRTLPWQDERYDRGDYD